METIYALRDPGKPGDMLPPPAPITDTDEKLERQTATLRWHQARALVYPLYSDKPQIKFRIQSPKYPEAKIWTEVDIVDEEIQ